MASRPQQQASPSDAAQQQQQPEQQQLLQGETLISSPPGLWLPTSVVKRHRKTATVIWIALLGVFFAYVFYIVYDGFEQRRNPAASMEVKEEVFTLPDIAVCVYQGQGCYTTPSLCMGVGAMVIGLQSVRCWQFILAIYFRRKDKLLVGYA